MKQRKDVLILCQFFYPEYISSATLPFDTAKALRKEGITVDVICGYPKEYNNASDVSQNEIKDGIKIRRLKYLQLKRSNIVGRLINYFSFTFAVCLIFSSLRQYRSIIVYSNPPVLPLIAAWASKVFKQKLIFVSYDVYPEIAVKTNSISKNGAIAQLMRFINTNVFNKKIKVVALSYEMKAFLLENRKNLASENIVVIPNWYENTQDDYKSRRDSYSNPIFSKLNPTDSFIVSYFGNMGICQDTDTILNAARKLKQDNTVRFIFAGHGVKKDAIKCAITEEGLDNIIVFDFLHGQDYQDALNISDCFLVSLAEGISGLAVPSKTYSYMMAGKPVLAIMDSDTDISNDLIHYNAGFAIKVGESDKLTNAITSLKNDKDLKVEMGLNIRSVYLNKYTTEKCTQKYVDLMRAVLEEN